MNPGAKSLVVCQSSEHLLPVRNFKGIRRKLKCQIERVKKETIHYLKQSVEVIERKILKKLKNTLNLKIEEVNQIKQCYEIQKQGMTATTESKSMKEPELFSSESSGMKHSVISPTSNNIQMEDTNDLKGTIIKLKEEILVINKRLTQKLKETLKMAKADNNRIALAFMFSTIADKSKIETIPDSELEEIFDLPVPPVSAMNEISTYDEAEDISLDNSIELEGKCYMLQMTSLQIMEEIWEKNMEDLRCVTLEMIRATALQIKATKNLESSELCAFSLEDSVVNENLNQSTEQNTMDGDEMRKQLQAEVQEIEMEILQRLEQILMFAIEDRNREKLRCERAIKELGATI